MLFEVLNIFAWAGWLIFPKRRSRGKDGTRRAHVLRRLWHSPWHVRNDRGVNSRSPLDPRHYRSLRTTRREEPWTRGNHWWYGTSGSRREWWNNETTCTLTRLRRRLGHSYTCKRIGINIIIMSISRYWRQPGPAPTPRRPKSSLN